MARAVCVLRGSTHVVHPADYFGAHGLGDQPVIAESITQARDEFFAGRRLAYTSDASSLGSVRVEAPGRPGGYRIRAGRISN